MKKFKILTTILLLNCTVSAISEQEIPETEFLVTVRASIEKQLESQIPNNLQECAFFKVREFMQQSLKNDAFPSEYELNLALKEAVRIEDYYLARLCFEQYFEYKWEKQPSWVGIIYALEEAYERRSNLIAKRQIILENQKRTAFSPFKRHPLSKNKVACTERSSSYSVQFNRTINDKIEQLSSIINFLEAKIKSI